jgi:cell wall-associated NlpC family hydrolase
MIDADPSSPTFNAASRIPTGAPQNAITGPIAVTPDGHFAFIGNFGSLIVLDTSNGFSTALSTAALGISPGFQPNLELSPDGRFLVANSADFSSLLVFGITTPATPTLVATVRGTTPLPGFPRIVGSRLYSFDNTVNTVVVFNFNPAQNDFAELATFVVPGTLSEFGAIFDVTPDGKLLYLPMREEDSVAVLDVDKILAHDPTALVTKVAVGIAPSMAAIRPGTAEAPQPSMSGLGQFAADGTTVIREGGTIVGGTVILKSTLQSSSTNPLVLQLEVQPFSTPFLNRPSATSSAVNAGERASVTVANLTPGQYHWQARAVDLTNSTASPWREFGTVGNVDFILMATLQEAAAARARSLLNHPYFEGAKGYDMTTKNTNPPFPYVSVDSASSGTSSISGGYLHCTTAGCPPKISLDTTKPGIDCSGLVFWSYNTAAGALQTDTADNPLPSRTVQEGAGGQFNAKTSTHVDLANLKPGDLLFFNYDPGAGVAVSHVAMYVGPTSDFPEGEVVEAYLPNAVLRGNHGIISSSCDIKAGCKRAQEDPVTHESLDCTKIPRPNNCFVDYRTLNLPKKFAFVAATQSPIGLIVTDPDGYTITPDTTILTTREVLHEIPDQLYYGTNDKGDDEVIGLTLKSGDYLIKPVPKPDALPGDTYGLTVTVESSTLTLAQNVPISDIPIAGYGVASTGSTIAVFIPVAIDIKPGDTPNSINPKSNGKIPVAILSNHIFDAGAQIDQTSLTFGRTGDEASLASCHTEDVNSDGLVDLVCHFNTQSTGFLSGDTVGVLKSKTIDATPVRGTDSVNIVPK